MPISFYSGRRVVAALVVGPFFLGLMWLLVSEKNWKPTFGLVATAVIVYFLGWRTLRWTTVGENEVVIRSGWRPARHIPYPDIASVDASKNRAWILHAGGRSRIEGLEDGTPFAYRYANRQREVLLAIEEARTAFGHCRSL